MSSSYEYKDKHFSSEVVKYHFGFQYGKQLNIKKAGRQFLQWHLEKGGLPPRDSEKLEEEVIDRAISTAIKALKREGRARQINADKWYFPKEGTQIYGSGNECVYCFYDPRDRAEAESNGKQQWTCNIGKTKRDFETRVGEQTKEWTQDPEIGLVLYTSDAVKLEGKIHKLLKTLDRHLKGFRAKGNDWYSTCPEEVLFLYRVIEGFKSGRSSSQLVLFNWRTKG